MSVIIAFSGGLESTYLFYKLMEEGHQVKPAYLNVSGVHENRIAEYIARDIIVDHLAKKYGDRVARRIYMNKPSVYSTVMSSREQNVHAHNVNQQANTAIGLMHCRKHCIEYAPLTATGWIREDGQETSMEPFDYTTHDYDVLKALPETLGKVSGLDGAGVKIHTPLWNMSKREIWDALPDDLKNLLIFNGLDDKSKGTLPGSVIRNNTIKSKIEEYAKIGVDIPVWKDYNFDDLGEMSRWATGLILPKDVPGVNDELKGNIKLLRELLKTSYYYKLLTHGPFDYVGGHVRQITENINEMYTLFKDHFKGPDQ